jgi:hypothetical protein
MIQHEWGMAVSIRELPPIVVRLLERAQYRLVSGVHGQVALFVQYLRRKQGQGLVIIYRAGALNASRRTHRSTVERRVTVTIGEAAFAATHIAYPLTTCRRPRWTFTYLGF